MLLPRDATATPVELIVRINEASWLMNCEPTVILSALLLFRVALLLLLGEVLAASAGKSCRTNSECESCITADRSCTVEPRRCTVCAEGLHSCAEALLFEMTSQR